MRDRFAGILGMGSYVPDRVVTNRDMERLVDTTDEWIKERTGIRERRIAAEGGDDVGHGDAGGRTGAGGRRRGRGGARPYNCRHGDA